MKKLLVTIVLTLAVVLAGTPTALAGKPDGKGKPAQQEKGRQKPEADYQTGGPDDSANTGKNSDANNNDDSNSNGHQRNEWVVEEGSKAHDCDANGGHCVTPEPTPEAPSLTPTPQEPTPQPTPQLPTPEPVDSSTGPDPIPTQDTTSLTPEPEILTLPEDAGTCYDCDPCQLLEQILAEEQKQTQLLEEQNGLLHKIYDLLLSVLS